MARPGLSSNTAFFSTRGAGPVSLAQALFTGLAQDGGLFLPRPLPKLDWPYGNAGSPSSGESRSRVGDSFQESAQTIAGALLPGMRAEARAAARAAIDFPAPLVEIAPGAYILELFHGPSCAFKDVGARFMAALMARVTDDTGPSPSAPTPHPTAAPRPTPSGAGSPRTVLVATSGDTGGAVVAAFTGLEGCRTVPLFPLDAVTERQRRQMTTLGGNVTAVAVRGTFDDCQALAKAAFADRELRATHRLTSANSINVGRLLPQTFYYAHAVGALERAERGPPRFVVPSGNLGNLCAGLLAHRAGVPTAGFVAACNANDAFPRYMSGTETAFTGAAPRPGDTLRSQATLSSAMDVAVPSNLERIQAIFPNRDDLGALVTAVSVSDAQTADCMERTWKESGYLLDPHTAVGVHAHERIPACGAPTVILSTAHPAKFPEVVEPVTGVDPELPPSLAAALERDERWVEIAPDVSELAGVLA